MPFTLAHPAVVLPLRWSHLPLAALVAGSLSPDVPIYVPGGLLGTRDEAHSWTHTWFGLVAFCVPVALLLTAVWGYYLRGPVLDALPDWCRARMTVRPPVMDRGHWLWSLPAVLVGSLSHLAWDQLTHEPSWLSAHLPFLAMSLGGLPVARWLMYLCSVLGLAAICWTAYHDLARRPPDLVARRVPSVAALLLPVPMAVGGLAALYELVTVGPYMGAHAIAYYMLTAAVASAGALVVLLAGAWHGATLLHRRA
ncbi:DUF4184 family protein [Arsenicicoccus dermatophilus]|uniref:DUF4184 family protein n=1 Tax=Arsenicicoccus dermatophilus TaxID=1076331 RepID=UPI001F4C6B10|nr:DUF4184 family protein [Arsenicicoccus dermatophilus]